MATDQMMGFVAGLVLGMALAAALAWLLLARRVKHDKARMLKVTQAHQLSAQQVTQARKQIEQLQRECHELKLALRPHHHHHATAPMPVEAPVDPAEAARQYAENLLHPKPDENEEPELFPNTLIMRRPTSP